MDFLLPLGVFEKHCIHLRNDSELDLDKIRKELVRLGYESTFQVESTGQFSVRGGILDIYPLTEQNPIRIELWGDEIDSIRSFDAESQRSIETRGNHNLSGIGADFNREYDCARCESD